MTPKQFLLGIKIMFCILLFNNTGGYSQQMGTSDFWQNMRYGGGLGLGVSNNAFNISLAPSALYQVNNDFATGIGLNFNYSKFDDDRLIAYGGSLLNFFNPIPQIQLSAELEQWRVNQRIETLVAGSFEENYWFTALFLGIGYSSRNVTVGLRYDVLYDTENSIYIDPLIPFIRVYF